MTLTMDDISLDSIDSLLAVAREGSDRNLYFELIALKSQFRQSQEPPVRQAIEERIRSAANKLYSTSAAASAQSAATSPSPPASAPFAASAQSAPSLPAAATPSLRELSQRVFQKSLNRDTVIKCKGITKKYRTGDFKLKVEDLQIQAGTITGLVGENGNGKSTLLKIMAGSIAPDAGEVIYPSVHSSQCNWRLIKSKVAYLPQDIAARPGKVLDSIRQNAVIHGLPSKEIDLEVDYIITRLGISHLKNARWSELSGGYKLKFALARILVTRPSFMLLDEPLANLDINAQNALLNDLRNLSRSLDNPIAIVISSQLLEEVEAVADSMILLSDGKIAYQGPSVEIGSDRQYNAFELRTPLNKFELQAILSELEHISIEQTALSYIITTPRTTEMQQLMTYCVGRQIPVSHLSDISHSTKKFFLQKQ